MPNFRVEYETVVKAWTVIEADTPEQAQDIVCKGITGTTNIKDRQHRFTSVKRTGEEACAFKPKKLADVCSLHASKGPEQKPLDFIDMTDPRKVDDPDLPDVGDVIEDVMDRMGGE